MKVLWGLRVLPDGLIRNILQKEAHSLSVRIREYYIIPSFGRGLFTACVLGFGRWKWVLFSERLMELCDNDMLRAVSLHEFAHVKFRHQFLYLLMVLNFIPHLAFAEQHLAINEAVRTPIIAGAIVGFWFVLFPLISRAFEEQCDLFAVRIIGSAGPLVRVFEIFHNLHPAKRLHLRHYPPQSRIARLIRAENDPLFKRRILLTCRLFKIMIFVLLLSGIIIQLFDFYRSPG
jgi:Zn-dependent protease with chaperone function